jgi:branched-chain amino acid transport system permease protein
VLDTLLQGVLLGGLYCLFALGQSLMFGVMRLTNTAQGDFIVLAAFGGIVATTLLGMGVALAALLLLPLAFGVGFVLQHYVLGSVLGKNPLPSLVVTFGLSIIIQNGLLELFSADPRSIDAGALATASIDLPGGVALGVLPLVIFAAALICTGGLEWLFRHTALGRAFRAVSDDREMAELMGLNSSHIHALATAIAFVVIALGGLLQAMRTTVSPTDGPALLLFAFEAVIMGGMGSFWGTLLGALVLGVAQQVGFRFDPGWGIWLGHVVFLALLALRPEGLYPKTRG